MTPCGDNATVCTMAGHVHSPKREALSPPSVPLLAEYYARQPESKEKMDKLQLEALLRWERFMQEVYQQQKGRNGEKTDMRTPYHLSEVVPSSDIGNQPLDLSTSKRPRSNESMKENVPIPPMQTHYSNNGYAPAAAIFPPYSQAQPVLPVYSSPNIQQMFALAFLQNKQLVAQQALQDYEKRNWLALRDQQLATAMQGASKTSRKRTISVSSIFVV